MGLVINQKKTGMHRVSTPSTINFLGYSISFPGASKISIAPSKIGKFKSRIALSLKAFYIDRDFNLLISRMEFLSTSTILTKRGRKKPVHTGFRHLYSLCSVQEIELQMKELDTFFRAILYSNRYSFAKKLRKAIGSSRMSKLEQISFYSGFTKKITFKRSQDEIAEIRKAWLYG